MSRREHVAPSFFVLRDDNTISAAWRTEHFAAQILLFLLDIFVHITFPLLTQLKFHDGETEGKLAC